MQFIRLHHYLRPHLFAATVLLCAGCGPTVLYEKTARTGPAGWSYADTLSFAYEVPDTRQAYDLEIIVEHSVDFPSENFYLKIYTDPPNGRRSEERISLDLAGDFGAWYGDCSGGQSCTVSIPILTNTRFQEPGSYGITLEQFSRQDPLPGIQGIGLRLVEAEGTAN